MEGTSYGALSLAPDRDAFQRALLRRLVDMQRRAGGRRGPLGEFRQ
jgi:hypothetical protein